MVMTVFFLIASTLGLLSVLGAAILIPYLNVLFFPLAAFSLRHAGPRRVRRFCAHFLHH